MGVLTPFRPERPVDFRMLLFYRADPADLERLVPAPLRARTIAGQVVVTLVHTRLLALRPWLRQAPGRETDHLAVRIEVERRSDSRPGTWIPRRFTSSWLRWGAGLAARSCERARFDVQRDEGRIDLEVRGKGRLVFRCAARLASRRRSATFPRETDLRSFFPSAARVQPADHVAPEADRLGLEWLDLEPLEIGSSSIPCFEEVLGLPTSAFTFDSAVLAAPEARVRASELLGAGGRAIGGNTTPAATAFARAHTLAPPRWDSTRPGTVRTGVGHRTGPTRALRPSTA